MTVDVDGARAGLRVDLERRSGQTWKQVATGSTNGRGEVEFQAATGDPANTYRARTDGDSARSAAVSASVRTDVWGAPDFTDEFTGDQLGDSWSTRQAGYSDASGRTCSRADDRAVSVADGVATLSVLKDPDRSGQCTYEGKSYDWRLNGHVGTQGVRSFTYGVAAARIKFQASRGQHGAFWMQPSSRTAQEGDPKNTGAEVDVVEYFGDHHPFGGLTSFVYSYPDDGKEGVTGKKHGGFLKHADRLGSDWSKKFHVFSVEWTPQHYIFRVDGRESFRTDRGVSDRPEYLILSLLSSDYELSLLKDQLPQTMSVDWVRHWKLPE